MARPREQAHQLSWPLTASQVEGLNEMLQTLFRSAVDIADSGAAAADLTNLNATNLTSGLVPDARVTDTAVTPGAYGDGTHVSQITVDSKGRVTSAADVAITGTSGVVLANGSVPFTADQSMGTHKITNVVDPANPQEAATKAYVDSAVGGVSTTAPSTALIFCHAGWTADSGDTFSMQTDNNEYYLDCYKAGGGQWIEFLANLLTGTYSLTLFFYQSPNASKIDIAIDSVNVVSAYDAYAAGYTPHTKHTFTGLTVSTSSAHTIRVTANGKNASSSDYHMGLFHLFLWRTGP